MAFVPDKFDKENVPLPNLDTVKNTTQPEMLLAAYRYSGRHRITPVKIYSKLREWIKENNPLLLVILSKLSMILHGHRAF